MYEIIFFSKFISHKEEIKVNNLTPDCVQNSIYPLEVFKCDSIEPNILNKSQTSWKKSSCEIDPLKPVLI